MSCSETFANYNDPTTNLTDPNGGKLFVRHTLTNPRFWISFHHAGYDHVRFSTFEYGYYYEKVLTQAFQQVLSQRPPANLEHHQVIDVGGNIGWFSLLAASLGAHVTTFEPSPHNTLRTCESMRLNGWLPCSSDNGGCLAPSQPNMKNEFDDTNIHLYPYGISDKEANLFFEIDSYNPGGSRVVNYEYNMTTALRVVSLDYLAKELGWLNADISILKVDVEGEELGVFRGAKELLQSKRVRNLFIEGGGKSRPAKARFRQVLGILFEASYDVYKIGGYRGPSNPAEPLPAGTNRVQSYFDKCTSSKSSQCNMWWRPSP